MEALQKDKGVIVVICGGLYTSFLPENKPTKYFKFYLIQLRDLRNQIHLSLLPCHLQSD